MAYRDRMADLSYRLAGEVFLGAAIGRTAVSASAIGISRILCDILNVNRMLNRPRPSSSLGDSHAIVHRNNESRQSH